MSKIELIHGSCADQEVDVVVNAANSYLWEGGGICGAIFSKAGSAELTEACKKYKTPLRDGDAVITPAFKMTNAKAIIHAVGPNFARTPKAFEELFHAYYNSLKVMMENGYHSISFPLISSGIFGGSLENPVGESTKQCCMAYRKFIEDYPDYDIDVKVCVYSIHEVRDAQMAFEKHRQIMTRLTSMLMTPELFYTKIPYVNKKVSRILYGTAIQPFLMGGDGNELLDAALAAGINTFDMARNYGLAERSIGNWLELRGCRDEVVLLSKCGHPNEFGQKRITESDIRKDFRETSEALRTDYIDIYLLHRDDPDVEVGIVVEIFNAMHAEGKIGAFGGSNWEYERIEAANEYAYKHNLIPFSVSSPNFGLAEQVQDPWGGGCVTISGLANAKARKWYEQNQMPVIAYSSLGRGLFSGKIKSTEMERASEFLDDAAMKGYVCPDNFERLRRCEELAAEKGTTVSQIAMNWIFGQGLNVFAVVSTGKPKRLQENIAALSLKLTKEELDYLDLQRETL